MTNSYLWYRIVGPDPNLRAADADRDKVAERLRKGHAEGRLDLTEFQQRLDQCYQAKTFGQLSELVGDLPREEVHTRRPSLLWMLPLRWLLLPLAPVFFALLLISVATGHHHLFWLWIPVVFIIWRMSSSRRRRVAGARRGPGDWL